MSKLTVTLTVMSILHCVAFSYGAVHVARDMFKAAVYGHAVILPADPMTNVSRDQAVTNMQKNVEVYRAQAQRAASQSADIIVFPEDGLYGFTFTRESIYPYLEQIPDPRAESWSPCHAPDRHPNTDILRALSCVAMETKLYLVANMGDKQPCDVTTDPSCPPDGRYQYNTDVAFGPDGTLLARYHKFHLFYEAQFNTPEAEIIYFDTPFGRFGLMVCFDVLFSEPGVTMVLKNNISNIVFPTAWMDALPLLSAIGFHSSFARGLGVNFLSANIHLPEKRFHGSGVYTPDGMKVSYYGATNTTQPKLLLADVDVLQIPKHNISAFLDELSYKDEQNRVITTGTPQDEFKSLLFFDEFTFRSLEEPSGDLSVCQNEICCHLDFAMNQNDFGRELFAFGAFDGLHTYEGQYYFQICALVKCADVSNKSSCGAVTSTTSTSFLAVRMSADLQTPYVYPQVVLSDPRGELQLAEAASWSFSGHSLHTGPSFNHTLLSAALFGRVYSRDNDSRSDIGIDLILTAGHIDRNNGGVSLRAEPFHGYFFSFLSIITHAILLFF
ncbi:pantetheinase-like [Physella acuta]|uniref:pantetheinase-like n=1 Tax=Physella acuta TaxID=109671 RepID=UPI0027DCDD7F|nr:pantetheinase-like [Physella acuta]